jgi:hypothetical protein
MGLVFAAGLTAGWVAACKVEQPTAGCKASHSSNYGIFDLTSAPDAGECSTLTGDVVAMSNYQDPDGGPSTLALSVQTIAAGLLADPRIEDFGSLIHEGTYPVEPSDGLCVAPTLSPVAVNIPSRTVTLSDGGTQEFPAMNVRYEFSNVRVVSTSLVPGTQWTADLAYTAGGCTSTYSVVGVSPLVTCHEVDEDGDPVLTTEGALVPAPEKCNVVNLADGGRSGAISDVTGEVANIDFNLVCDTKERTCAGGDPCLVCRPNGPVPALLND